MAFINKSMGRAAILAAAVAVCTTIAGAEQFKINLPLEARLGAAVLEPGSYTVKYSMGSPLVEVSGVGKCVRVLALTANLNHGDAGSSVRVTEDAGSPAIQELRSVSSGLTFRFAVVKPKHPQELETQGRAPVGK